VNEAQVRRRITVWSVVLGASVVVPYCYLLLLLGGLSNSRVHWLSLSLVVAALLHYFWFRRAAPELGRYWIIALIGIHVLGVLGAIVIFTILLVVAFSQMP